MSCQEYIFFSASTLFSAKFKISFYFIRCVAGCVLLNLKIENNITVLFLAKPLELGL